MSFYRNTAWLIANFCRYNYTAPPIEETRRLVPVLTQILQQTDSQTLSDACRAAHCVANGGEEHIQSLVDCGAAHRLIDLLSVNEGRIISICLRTLSMIATSGTDEHVDLIIDAGILPKLETLVSHRQDKRVVKALKTLRNIMHNHNRQVQQSVLDSDIFKNLHKLLKKTNKDVQKEAVLLISTAVDNFHPDQLFAFIKKYDILPGYCALLANSYFIILVEIETTLWKMFMAAEKSGWVEFLCWRMDKTGARFKLEALKMHRSLMIREKANDILGSFFRRIDR